MKIIFVRHGYSEANKDHIFSNRNYEIHPLLPEGINQAKTVASELKSKVEEGSPLFIYASPLLRAKQTAQFIADTFSQDYRVIDAILEFDVGSFEGTYYSESWKKYEQLTQDWFNNQNKGRRMGETGESYNDVINRFIPFVLESLPKNHPQNATVILVGHGGTYKCMLPEVLEGFDHFSTKAIYLDNTEFVIAETQGEGQKLKTIYGPYFDLHKFKRGLIYI